MIVRNNIINLRLISDYRIEDKDFSREPRKARVNTRVECQCPSRAYGVRTHYAHSAIDTVIQQK